MAKLPFERLNLRQPAGVGNQITLWRVPEQKGDVRCRWGGDAQQDTESPIKNVRPTLYVIMHGFRPSLCEHFSP